MKIARWVPIVGSHAVSFVAIAAIVIFSFIDERKRVKSAGGNKPGEQPTEGGK